MGEQKYSWSLYATCLPDEPLGSYADYPIPVTFFHGLGELQFAAFKPSGSTATYLQAQ